MMEPGALAPDFQRLPMDPPHHLERHERVAHEESVEAAGIHYVDIAAMGGFSTYGYRAPFVLSGPAAERAAAWMRPLGFDVSVMSDRAGDSSSVKIIRSIMVKGLEALCRSSAMRTPVSSKASRMAATRKPR